MGKSKKKSSHSKSKGQVFSLDTIAGVVIFLIVFTLFFALILQNTQKEEPEVLSEEAEYLAAKLLSEDEDSNANLGIANNGVVIEESIRDLSEYDYEELKQKLGIKGDFCIFFEDENGNVINLTDIIATEDTQFGIGSDKINISGFQCGMRS